MKQALMRVTDGLLITLLLTPGMFVGVWGAGIIGVVGFEAGTTIDLSGVSDLTAIWITLIVIPYFVLVFLWSGIEAYEFVSAQMKPKAAPLEPNGDNV